MPNIIKTLLATILKANTEDDIRRQIDAAIPDFLDTGWAGLYEDESEAYSELGGGEAESQVLKEVITSAAQLGGIELDTDQYCWLVEELESHWGIST
ncbi:hypothetical protein KAR91_15020 [Candidatus Pacearchaeota archaeon]|nr:hypothetical protein [Candidatus Pacearchaeota archaeon]